MNVLEDRLRRAERALRKIADIDPQVYYRNQKPVKGYAGPHAEIALEYFRERDKDQAWMAP